MYINRNKKLTNFTKYYFLVFSVISLGLIGCGSAPTYQSTSESIGTVPVGPSLSSNFGLSEDNPESQVPPAIGSLQLEVAVPPFDPNLNSDKAEKQYQPGVDGPADRSPGDPEFQNQNDGQNIWPELRRAESTRFALQMKSSLEETKAFSSVRIVPSLKYTADLYVNGKIIQSNGEDVEIEITCYDISGRKWFTKSFSHRVDERFHKTYRNKGKDSYQPVFEQAAKYIIKRLKKQDENYLATLPPLKEIRFASSMSEESFRKFLASDGKQIKLTALPAFDDPMFQRVRVIRVRDQLFVDRMQAHYMQFDSKLEPSYLVWQERTLPEAKAAREARSSSSVKTVLGALAIGLAIAGAASDDYDTSSATRAATAAALVGGALAIQSGLQDSAESRVHLAALNELGESLDLELGPQVVEFENKTEQLTGSASEQYEQWIAFLKKIYALEATPETQL